MKLIKSIESRKKKIYRKYPELQKGFVGDYMVAVYWLALQKIFLQKN